MSGLGILLVIVFYVGLSLLLIIKVKPIWVKIIVLAMAILWPTADAVYGRYKLKQMCEAEGGVKIYRVAHNVKGFMTNVADSSYIQNYGYQFVEANGKRGTYYRVSLQGGEIVMENKVVPISKFQVKFTRPDRTKEYRRYTYSIETFPNGDETLATTTNISFRGGWAEKFLAKFAGGGGAAISCSKKSIDRRALILSVLKP